MLRIPIRTTFYAFGHGKKAWYLNHINDIYVKKANELNYRSRASFKLLEILKKHPSLIKSNNNQKQAQKEEEHRFVERVLDLGCAPGSWSQVLREILPDSSSIVGVDLLQVKPFKGVDLYHCDARSQELHQVLSQKYGKFQLIVSDMAPNFDGDKANTHISIIELNSLCVQLCFLLGSPSCSLVMKTIQGQKEKLFFNCLSSVFKNVHRQKPSSSRSQSMEFFYVCEKLIPVNHGQASRFQKQFEKISLNVEIELKKYGSKKDSMKYVQSLLKGQ